jgi:hypothetical protein
MMLYTNDIIFTLMIAAFITSYVLPAVISYIMKNQQGTIGVIRMIHIDESWWSIA